MLIFDRVGISCLMYLELIEFFVGWPMIQWEHRRCVSIENVAVCAQARLVQVMVWMSAPADSLVQAAVTWKM